MKSSRLKNLLRNIALSFGSLGCCLLLAELVLRGMGYGNLEIYLPDPLVYWRLEPNQDCFTKIGRKPVHINSHGTRGPEFEIPKRANTLRIISIGDSVTFGWGLTESETYSHILGAHLQNQLKNGVQIEVINAGVNAWSYTQMTVFLREYGLHYQPDYVILAGANLWTQFTENADPAFVRKFMSRVRLKNFLRRFALYHYIVEVQLEDFYQRNRSRFIPVDPKQDPLFKEQQKTDADAIFRDAIEQFCQIAKINNVKPVLLHIPMLTDLEAGIDSTILQSKREVAAKLQVPLLDCTEKLKEKGKSLFLPGDPVHPNAQGNEIVGRFLAEEMRRILNYE